MIFSILFTQNIDCEYPQSMFWSKNIKHLGIPLHTPVFLYKIVVQRGILFIDMFS